MIELDGANFFRFDNFGTALCDPTRRVVSTKLNQNLSTLADVS